MTSQKRPRLIAVLRQCPELPGAKPRPDWFDKGAAMATVLREVPPEDCIIVFDTSRGGALPAHVQAAGDGGVRIVAGEFGCDRRSMLAATKVVLEMQCAPEDIVYFVEDDYVHRRGWSDVLREAFDHNVADYVTLYDHPDAYDQQVNAGLRCRLSLTPSAHWRSTPSTTNTWAVRVGRLTRDLPIHSQFLSGYGHHSDHEKFLALAAIAGARLASCIPGWSTHCHLPLLSPTITWGPMV